MPRLLVLLVVFVPGLTACGKVDTTIAAAAFDQRCATDRDCSPAFTGDVCAPCPCNNDAIAQSAVPAYWKENDDKRAACGPSNVGCFCSDPVPLCVSGRCVGCDDAACRPDAGPPGSFSEPPSPDD